MKLTELTAVSPVDGRYRDKISELAPYFSEFGLIKYRVLVEVEYFIALCNLPLPQLKDFNKDKYIALRDIYKNFTIEDALEVKNIEKTTNHDVKAVEYLLRKYFDKLGLEQYKEFIHFGLTSQDINNTATPMLLKEAVIEVYVPLLNQILSKLCEVRDEWDKIPLLAHTHGQPASPTRLGKEIQVFIERVEVQKKQLGQIPWSAKFGGATGNFNAHVVAYPQIDWVKFGNQFVNETLGLSRSQTTTQIEHYDNLAATFDALKRINTILIDLCRDMWTYISMEYFKQKVKKDEVGSSAMPHKVNPIDFENAEGNFGIANAIFEHLSAKLPISRMQRDLTDSTVLRNVGVPLSHTVIALKSLQKGMGKVIVNETAIKNDLEKNWAVVAEAIQTILRRENYPDPYNALKLLTRGNNSINEASIKEFVTSLEVSDAVKKELLAITPFNYTGI
ncbi:MAG TPA: adenylosuccinate lyase [Bacteroidales bacterium]|nr:adenylosuccinate lyase [Bacteroidales bacterium]